MTYEARIRSYAHRVIEQADVGKIRAILELLEDDFFTEEEVSEIKALSASEEWTDWRDVRDDV